MEFTESALGKEADAEVLYFSTWRFYFWRIISREALGKLYCAKYFDASSKERANAIIEQVRQSLEDRLKEVDWMKSEDTRKNALKKMERFGVK
eukprot:scaffold92450_cov33-Cyclotella_meneghiniana.AAC.1